MFISTQKRNVGFLVIKAHIEREPGYRRDGINMICHSLSMLGGLATFIKFMHQHSHL